MPRPKSTKPAKRTAAQKLHIQNLNKRNKENVPPPREEVPVQSQNPPVDMKKKLDNANRKRRHLRDKVAILQGQTDELSTQLQQSQKENRELIANGKLVQSNLEGTITTLQNHLSQSAQMNTQRLAEIKNLKRRLKRAQAARTQALQEKKSAQPTLLRLKNGRKGAYSADSRKMARLLVLNGCARSKVGHLLTSLASGLGVTMKRSMSTRTVGRAVLEGLVASNMQLGEEIGNSEALTISADSTSNRGINFESRHIAMRVPDYGSGSKSVSYSSKPKMRLLRVDSTIDHTAEGAVKGFIGCVSGALDIFNRSPSAARLKMKVSIRGFLRALKGMNGDHASKEKSSAKGMEKLKQESSIEDLADTAVQRMESLGTYVEYLSAWNQWKIAQHGGIDQWNQLTASQQAHADRKLMEEIRKSLGEQEYNELSDEERRVIDLFIWAGCCMHKDQNSFQAGNNEMMAAWATLSITPPIILANKGNAATLRRILEPGANPAHKMTDDEQRAFEQSTRGGVKTAALAGAIFRNKDDKKGQGDRHSDHFKIKVSSTYTRFPDTSNTRFGSHGDAATDLIQYLDAHIQYLHTIRLTKQSATFTQIESNVLVALEDKPTLTELCAMALYHQAVSKPYMRAVRVEADNVLELGPLHALVREFVEGVVQNPDVVLADLNHPRSYVEGTLDGKPWDNPHAIHRISHLLQALPHVREITVAFFRGTLATWERFSAEFAPGGLIDSASAEEKHLAWMPATNDVNEGALGQYRVVIRGKPSLTLHQYNAMAMFRHNDTQAYMDVMFQPADHDFIMSEARKMDASGLERTRKKELVDFRMQVAQIRKEKEAARAEKIRADEERLSKIGIIERIDDIYDPSLKFTIKRLGDQLDAMRFRGLPDVPAKSRFPKKADIQNVVKETFLRYQEWISIPGNDGAVGAVANIPAFQISPDWEALEEEEYGE